MDCRRGNKATRPLGLLLRQEVERQCVWLAVKMLEQGVFKNLVIGGRGHEQSQA